RFMIHGFSPPCRSVRPQPLGLEVSVDLRSAAVNERFSEPPVRTRGRQFPAEGRLAVRPPCASRFARWSGSDKKSAWPPLEFATLWGVACGGKTRWRLRADDRPMRALQQALPLR